MTFNISRYRDISSEEFDLEVVTPMFLGGADPVESALRAASMKGVLRFWWRVKCDAEDLRELKCRESEIFGSTEKKSSFSIIMRDPGKIVSVSGNLSPGRKVAVEGKKFKIGIIDYLAFGIRDNRQGYMRRHIPSGSVFSVALRFKEEHRETLLDAFRFFAAYGGLGAKTRNGFGSLRLVGDKQVSLKAVGKMKPFTALSNETELFEFGVHSRWEDALSEIGMAYRAARLGLEPRHRFDKRLLIAKPIVQSGNGNDRHAKPFFLHVNKLLNGKYQGQILFMPYRYYVPSKQDPYMDVCRKMRSVLVQAAGGVK